MLQTLFMVLFFFTALLLIVLILLQKGKGGGLAGAFGGMGGQSAFGTKAGDLFTRITIGLAFFWILLCIAGVKFLGTKSQDRLDSDLAGGSAPQNPDTKKADTTGAPSVPGNSSSPAKTP